MTHAPLTLGIEDWLLSEAPEDPDTPALVAALRQPLHGIGVPVDRALMSWPILHPLLGSEEVSWTSDGEVGLVQYDQATIGGRLRRQSLLAHVDSNRLACLRRRLSGEGALLDFTILEEFAAEGFTDCFVAKAVFRVGDMPTVPGNGRASS
ncbi:MAG: hypothetical protein AAF844_22375 [Pseudomonadota bacterium]